MSHNHLHKDEHIDGGVDEIRGATNAQNGLATDSQITALEANTAHAAVVTGNPHSVTLEEARSENSQLSGNIDANGNKVTGLGSPAASGDAATRGYVDGLVQGLDWQESVIDKDLNDPPGGESEGDRYIVAAGGINAWLGHDEEIAEWISAAWVFTTPDKGTACWIEDESVNYVYNGDHPAGSWVTMGSTTDHGNLIGLGDDDHTQYLKVDGARAMGAALDMGGFAVTNVGNVDGVDVSAHAARHVNGDSIQSAGVAQKGLMDTAGQVLTGAKQFNDKISIGDAALANEADMSLRKDGVLAMKETATPTADANHGKLYTKSDNRLYFQDGAGNEHEVGYSVGLQDSWLIAGVNLKTVAQTDLFTVPAGYRLLVDTAEIIVDTITVPGAMPTCRFGLDGDEGAFVGVRQIDATMNEVGARQSWDCPQDSLAAGQILEFGVTIAGASTSHTGTVLVTGRLLEA